MQRTKDPLDRLIKSWTNRIHWPVTLLALLLGGVGVLMMYSAAGGDMEPWALRQLIRFGIGVCIMFGLAFVPLRTVYAYAYVLYGIGILMLVAVDVAGHVGMGAQRWIALGGFNLQPSELMKIALILVIARYFHHLNFAEIGKIPVLIPPILMVFVPAGLIFLQPNLGTATITVIIGGAMFFAAGVRWWKFALVIAALLIAAPVAWNFLHDYQKQRVYTFLDPESDPLGSGYNIMQSKIAIGSGGVAGKGFLKGSQSQLSFLPEKQTDFIFTMLAEEFGLVGGMLLLASFVVLLFYAYMIAFTTPSHFGRLMAFGVAALFFAHIFINIAMVMGLIPVVGVPLPFLSYGGSIQMTVFTGIGLLLSVHASRKDTQLPR